MTISLDLGDSRYIIKVAKEMGFLRNELAYVLSTAYHETWHTIKPIKETQKPTETTISDATVKSRLTNAFKKGQLPWVKKDYWNSGFFGRGYVQLTHEENHAKAKKELGVDFVKNPSKVMEREYATLIILRGMKEGWFTGKKLSDYITLSKSDYFNARAIINGDKNKVDSGKKMGDRIAEYAKSFEKLLITEGYGVENVGQKQQNVVESTPILVPEEAPEEVKQEISEAGKEADKPILKKTRTWTWGSVLAAAPMLGFGGLHWGAQLALVLGVMGVAVYALVTIPAVKKWIEKLLE